MLKYRREVILIIPLLLWVAAEVDHLLEKIWIVTGVYLPVFLARRWGKTPESKFGIGLAAILVEGVAFWQYFKRGDGLELLFVGMAQVYFLIWVGMVTFICWLPPVRQASQRTKNILFVIALSIFAIWPLFALHQYWSEKNYYCDFILSDYQRPFCYHSKAVHFGDPRLCDFSHAPERCRSEVKPR